MYINGKKFIPKRFSSGEMKLLKSELNSYIFNNETTILYLNEESIFELLLIIDYYKNIKVYTNNKYNNTTINLIMSYLPYQRMDHEDRDELNTLQNVANVINSLSLNSLTICEPHSYIFSFKNAKEFSFVHHLKNKVFSKIKFNEEIDTIVLTDKGGLKRFGNLSKNIVYFNKVRDIQTGLIVKHEIVGEIKPNSKCLIVDDIISTGDTIINIVNHLTELNIQDIYVFSGHLEKNKYNKRLINHQNVKKIFSTNSLTKRQTKKLKLYNVKEIFYGK